MPRLQTSVGQLMVNSVLPEAYRDTSRVLDRKSLSVLLNRIAHERPEDYRRISHDLAQIGQKVAYTTGGPSFGLKHLRQAPSAIAAKVKLQLQLDDIDGDDSLDEQKRRDKIILAVGRLGKTQADDIYNESLAENNPLALQILSGARGNRQNLVSLRGSDLLYTDHRGRVLPVPVLNSYSQGLTPSEYWAGSYGARKGVIDLKMATRDAGYLCLAKGTLVRMADWSVKAIENVGIGDRVLGATRSGRTLPTQVTAVFANGLRKLQRFRFRYGKSRTRFLDIVATADHKVLCEHLRRRRRRPESKLQIEIATDVRPLGTFERRAVSWHSLVPPQGFAGGVGKHEPWAGFIGLLIAEGGLTTNHIGLSCGDEELLASIRAYAEPKGFSIRKKTGAQYEYSVVDEEPIVHEGRPGGGVVVGSFRNRLQKKLSKLGLAKKLAPAKTIPDEVDQWNNSSVAELLRWLFAGDGGVGGSNNSSTPTVTLGMTSEAVVRRAQTLLADRFGIYGQVCIGRNKGKPVGIGGKYKANHNTVMLAISDRESVQRFAKKIGFVSGIKQKRLQNLLRHVEPCGRRDRFLFHFAGVEDAGEGETFDLEVSHPDHLFVLANGAIVSNSKQLNQVSHRAMVVGLDADNEPHSPIGYPTDPGDEDNEGALLAMPTAGYPRNTVLTPKILSDLQRRKIGRILVRSPIATMAPDGGLYARDAGVREFGNLPTTGSQVGLTAAQALSEPLSQAQISSKHTGGVAGAAGSKAISGFDHINQLVQVPKTFRGVAAHATKDGTVQRIEEAPAGGHFITIDDEQHYVGVGFEPKVKQGDKVEAGDVISEGTPNPALVTKYKGIGEGKRYFVEAFRQAFRDADLPAHRRNVELLASGLINHVRLTKEMGDFAPDDIIPYSTLASVYKPRQGSQDREPREAMGQYLERPYLHYSIGTKIRPSMIKNFTDFDVRKVSAHPDPPAFEPEMLRGAANLQHDPDWITRMFGSGLKSGLLEGVQRGGHSSELDTSFVPGLAKTVNFGTVGRVITPARPKDSLTLPADPLGAKAAQLKFALVAAEKLGMLKAPEVKLPQQVSTS